jgi:hypothetical protein
MLRIEINCEPHEVDDHLKELGFMRRPVTGTEKPQTESPLKQLAAGRIVEQTENAFAAVIAAEHAKPSMPLKNDEEQSGARTADAPNPLADELAAMERPADLAPPEMLAGSTRVRGQPAPGRKRRTAAEVAEDLAHAQTDRPAQVPAAISTGEARVNPEDEAQDAADEAAESAARPPGSSTRGLPTMDDLRAAVKRYADKFGPEVAINNVRGILGCPMLEVAPTDIPSAIAKMDLATNAASQETSLFDDAPPAPRVATKQDIIAAMTAYCVKYDGTDDPNKAPNGQADLPRIMDKACGVTRISLLPQTPEGFGAAHAAILAATASNPFGRPVRQ